MKEFLINLSAMLISLAVFWLMVLLNSWLFVVNSVAVPRSQFVIFVIFFFMVCFVFTESRKIVVFCVDQLKKDQVMNN